uniref:Uncharacterized protein n=1 Tax=Glossina brevipalpis TaxID=37001 RepID=A0A1A9WDR9_9MUSC
MSLIKGEVLRVPDVDKVEVIVVDIITDRQPDVDKSIPLFMPHNGGSSKGWLFGWLAGWMAGWLVGWLVGWLTGWICIFADCSLNARRSIGKTKLFPLKTRILLIFIKTITNTISHHIVLVISVKTNASDSYHHYYYPNHHHYRHHYHHHHQRNHRHHQPFKR